MKRTVRIAVLMVGLVGTFIAAAVQQVPAADGGPLFLCPPRQPNCKSTLPAVDRTFGITATSLK
jgi:hypothetical protein